MYFQRYEEQGILQRKSKVVISAVSFINWSEKSNYPRYAVKKKFLVNTTKGKHEVEIMQQVNKLHPWTVKHYDSGFDDNGIFYILMEYCTKGDLRRFIRQNKSLNQNPPIDVLVRHFLSLADIVKVLHGHKIWHRDIKPDNIYRKEDGELRLGDYGVSKSYMNGEPDSSYHTITGTQPYMSPELAIRKKHKVHSISSPDSDDIWALGQTYYEMCTSERIRFTPELHFSIYSELGRRNYPESFSRLISGMLNPDLLFRWKIKDVWTQLMIIITTINIQPIYIKNDEGDEKDMNLSDSRETSMTYVETYSIQNNSNLNFTSVKHIIDIKRRDSSLSLVNYNVAAITSSRDNTINEEQTQQERKTLVDVNADCQNLGIIDANPAEKETSDLYYSIKAEERIMKNAETGSNLGESIVQTVKIATKIFKNVVPDLPDETVFNFLTTLYKENEEKLVCPICRADSWIKLSPQNWKPYKIRCKNCRSNFCSFCLYGGSHKKCPDYQNLLKGIWKSTKNLKLSKPLKII